MVGYVISIAGSAIGLGLLADWIVRAMDISMKAQVADAAGLVPAWLAVVALVVLVLLAIRPLRRAVIGG